MTAIVSLTEMQQAFVVHYTSTPGCIGNASAAARAAGYSEKTAAEQGRQLLEKPHVREQVDQANREALSGRIATKAVQALEEILDRRAELPEKIVLEASRVVLDRAGYSQPVADRREATRNSYDKPDHEMTLAELDAELAEARARHAVALAQNKRAERALRLVSGEATGTD